MKKIRSKLISLSLIILFCLCSYASINYVEVNKLNNDIQKEIPPNLSSNGITIVTPENITYTDSMDGYYPATYGFENEINGETNPVGFLNGDHPSTQSSVISNLDNHNKVIDQVDNNNGFEANLTHNFISSQQNGTLEFYVRTTKVASSWPTAAAFLYSSAGVEIELIIALNAFKFYNGTAWQTIMGGINVNQWYHVSIRWRCTGAPNYQGLTEGTWKIFIDSIEFGDYSLANDNYFDELLISSCGVEWGHHTYWDAIGLSWDPNYNIGDNLNDGLLLSFDNSTALDWIGYSLDGQPTNTILGNTTIPMPSDGSHTIRVFGNDSLGTNYQSNIRYFSVHHIGIVTPEDKVYANPMSGYYPATFGFENDKPGGIPQYWVLNSMDGSSFVEVDSNLEEHNNVVEIRKDGGTSSAGMRNDFDLNVSIGAVEFWLYKDTDSGTDATFFSVVSTDGFLGNAQGVISDGNFYYMTSTFATRTLVASGIFTSNTWHHLSMEFDISIGWQITIDGILYGQNYALPFRNSVTGNQMKSFFVQSLFSGGASNYGAWVDAVGYSWDPYYTIRDNFNEGLLLSYENSTTLDWQGYSLDGQPIKAIFGNTTIPMPGVGEHTIQVFGNDSLGTMYQSSIRHFTIESDIIAPDITINLPISDDLFGGAAPSFDLTTIEPNLDTIWYTLDGGLTTFITTEPTGIINPDLWNSRPDGIVSIRFYANDTGGNIGYEDVTVRKDTTPPVITIISPLEGQVFTDRAPSYELDIDEANPGDIWYTMDDGIVNFPCPESGTINQLYWNALPPGYYNLKFYANDTLGHVGFSEVIIKKEEPIIPGYNLIIFSLLIPLALMYIARRIKKKLK